MLTLLRRTPRPSGRVSTGSTVGSGPAEMFASLPAVHDDAGRVSTRRIARELALGAPVPRGHDSLKELSALVTDSLRPFCGALAALFSFFTVFNLFDLPAHAVVPVVAHDVVLVAIFGSGWRWLGAHRVSYRVSNPIALGITVLVLSNVLMTARLLRDSSYTNYVLIIVVGIGALVLSTRWVCAMLVLVYVAWAAVTCQFTTAKQFTQLSVTVLEASAVSIAFLLARRRTGLRLVELRLLDAERKRELEYALVQTRRSHDALDRRVAERTGELSQANEQLLTVIAQRVRADQELRLAAQVFDSSTSAIMITDPDGRLVTANRAFADITGYTREEVLGQTPDLVLLLPQSDFFGAVRAAVLAEGHWEGETANRRKGGEEYPSWMSVCAARDPDGAVTNYIGVFNEITERKAAEARIEHMAHHDALTGLPNRRLARYLFEKAIAQARRANTSVALAFLDVDRFKTINDSLGHPVGDQLLRQIALRISECVREVDIVAREGGDEFLVVLANLSDRADAVTVAQRILARVAEPYEVDGHMLSSSTSVGISVYPYDGEDFDTLHKKADIAMYRSKENGRNEFRFFEEAFTAEAVERLGLENQLRAALDRGELSLHFQPIVELESGRPVGAEALLRWESLTLGSVSPAKFIALAEETGLIMPIGQWVIEEACRIAAGWQREGMVPLKVSVNISGVQIKRGGVAEVVRRVLRETGLPPAALELELTESSLIQGVEGALETIRQLRQLGVSFAIDDFGTGYSNLAYLKRFDVQTLKIDQSFVKGLPNCKDNAAIVDAIVSLGRSLSLSTLAEGIEQEAEVEHLRRAGARLGQGFLFGRPMPAQEFAAYLASRDMVTTPSRPAAPRLEVREVISTLEERRS